MIRKLQTNENQQDKGEKENEENEEKKENKEKEEGEEGGGVGKEKEDKEDREGVEKEAVSSIDNDHMTINNPSSLEGCKMDKIADFLYCHVLDWSAPRNYIFIPK